MYNLTKSISYQFPGQDPPYVLDIFPVASGLAATTSDQHLSLFDLDRFVRGPVQSLKTTHDNLTCAKVYDAQNSVICTAGSNASISLWDLKSGKAVVSLQGCDAPISSLACDLVSQAIAAGTDFTNHQSSILIWDARSPSKPLRAYHEIHSDDITELAFFPVDSNVILTGSTDGLINISDIRIEDEDEVVVQAFNHGSIHHAGFLTLSEIWALSHDEKFAIYDMADPEKTGAAVVDFGDVRETLKCQYVANVTTKTDGSGAVVGAGSQDKQMFQLIHLAKSPAWAFDEATSVGLPGGHGEELVRSFVLYDDKQTVFTAGEDGQVISWRPG